MDRPENSRKPPGEQGGSPEVASVPLEPVSLLRQDSRGTRPARIIWLDDEERLLFHVSRLFACCLKDYNLVPCLNGDEALREIDRHPPDLLLTDYRHPGARLEQILLRLEKSPARFPILLSSASVGPETERGLRSSCTFTIEFLPKPFDCDHLLATIIKHLNASNPLPGLTLDASSLRGLNSGNT